MENGGIPKNYTQQGGGTFPAPNTRAPFIPASSTVLECEAALRATLTACAEANAAIWGATYSAITLHSSPSDALVEAHAQLASSLNALVTATECCLGLLGAPVSEAFVRANARRESACQEFGAARAACLAVLGIVGH